MLRITFAAGILVWTQFSCSSPLAGFVCTRDTDCATEAQDGVCEANQRCSFADDSCHSGQRYGPVAGEDSDRCTPLLADAATVDATSIPDAMAGIQDAAAPDAAPDASTTRVLSVVVAVGTEEGRLRVLVNDVLKTTCVSQDMPQTKCDYDVMLGDTIEIRRDGIQPDIIAGNCPIECVDLPCSFAMGEDCNFVGVFEAQN